MTMRDSLLRGTRAILIGALLTTASLTVLAAPSALGEGRAEVTADGLRSVRASAGSVAWMKPGADFKRYRKILFVADGMTFKGRLDRDSSEFPIAPERKQALQKMLLETFTEELGKLERFSLVDKRGKDVLVVRGAILDVVSHVAPEPAAGDAAQGPHAMGEARLVFELQDSMTGEFLARGIDTREVLTWLPNGPDPAAELRLAAREWARELGQRLDRL
jgi:hypothetical protein